MNTVKSIFGFCARAFFKTRDVVLGVGDAVESGVKSGWLILSATVLFVLVAVLVAFLFVLFGASKGVGIAAGCLVLLYYFFNLFRHSSPPRDIHLRGSRVDPNDESDEFP